MVGRYRLSLAGYGDEWQAGAGAGGGGGEGGMKEKGQGGEGTGARNYKKSERVVDMTREQTERET